MSASESTPESDIERALEQAREWVYRTYMPDSVRLICRALIACREPVEIKPDLPQGAWALCPSCNGWISTHGASHKMADKFCRHCGKALKWMN